MLAELGSVDLSCAATGVRGALGHVAEIRRAVCSAGAPWQDRLRLPTFLSDMVTPSPTILPTAALTGFSSRHALEPAVLPLPRRAGSSPRSRRRRSSVRR
jgi:hypothetical protein